MQRYAGFTELKKEIKTVRDDPKESQVWELLLRRISFIICSLTETKWIWYILYIDGTESTHNAHAEIWRYGIVESLLLRLFQLATERTSNEMQHFFKRNISLY